MKEVLLGLCIIVVVVVTPTLALLENCPPLPPHTPKDINDLHPNDIKVIMALGDSITAGFGIKGRLGLADEFRGLSFPIGADKDAKTVPNFFKQYVPDLIGSSVGHHILEVCMDPHCTSKFHPESDVLNAAQSGAKIDNLLGKELDYIISMLHNNTKVDMKNDWKVLTLFIGANDLCGDCGKSPFTLPQQYEKMLIPILEKVRLNIPRTFVNLIGIFNLSGVYEVALRHFYCKDIHRMFSFECDCVLTTNNTAQRQIVDEVGQAINQKLYDVQKYYASQKYSDFAVVVQPFNMNTNITSLNIDFLSDLDCFHPSLKAHEAMAVALWNAMLTPQAQKLKVMDPTAQIICPTADTLLYTN